MKKFLLLVMSICLLGSSYTNTFLTTLKLNAAVGENEHYSVSEATNSILIENNNNELDVKEKTSNNSDALDLYKKLNSGEENRVSELLTSGYSIVYENNTATELFLYNEANGEVKVIQYFEETLVKGSDGLYRLNEDVEKVARKSQTIINGVKFNYVINVDTPLYYKQDGVEFKYYLEDDTLRFVGTNKNKLAYQSDNGLLVTFTVLNNGIGVSKSLVDKSLTSTIEVRQIVNDYSFEEAENGYVVNGESGVVELSRYSNANIYEEIVDESPVDYAYELDEETAMLKIKEEFRNSIIELLGDIELIIEYQSNTYTASGTRYLRGIRSNGLDLAYPAGTPSNLPTGASNEPHYVRIGKNVDGFTGELNESFIGTGFIDDRLNYEEYVSNYHIGKKVVDNGVTRDMLNVSVESATLNLTVAGVGSTPSGGGISVGNYFRLYGSSKYEEAKSYTQGGSGYSNYTLTILSGSSLDPMSLSQRNYNNWIGGLNTTSASGNVVPDAVTKIHMDANVGSVHRFDVTNAISKWSRNNDGNAQVIRVANDAWDNYIASLSHSSGGPSIELTLKEMPNFAVNDYDINKTTIKLRSFAANDQKGSVYTRAIAIDGLTSYEAVVDYEIFDVNTNEVIVSGTTDEARDTYTYPYYNHSIDKAQNYYRLESNYQIEELIDAKKFSANKLYQVRVKAREGDVETEWINGDTFQIYNVGYKFETFYRILNFYGRSSDSMISESKIDNNMINPLISEKNSLFIRNPQKNKGKSYVASNLDDSAKWLIDQGLMGMNLKCEYGFEPINFNNGNFYYTSADAVIFNGQNRFEIERYYNSKKGGVETAFGRNWSSVFDANIQVLENGSIAFADPNGRVHVMSKNSDESYNPSYGENYTFEMVKVGDYVENVDSDYYIPAFSYPAITSEVVVAKYNYIVTTSDETKYYFDDLLHLIKIEYKNSQSIMFEHNNYGVSKVITDTGKVITLTYNANGYISKMTLPDLSEINYEYDADGNLVKFIDQNKVGLDYRYDSNYLMTGYKMSDSKDFLIENTYDEFGRVSEQVDINGNISRLSYNEGHTKITDGRGNSKIIYFNEYLYTTKVDDNGLITEYTYDSIGNVTSEKKYTEEKKDEVELTTYEYSGNDMVASTSPLKIKSIYSYDANANVTKIDNGSYVTTFEYDSNNNLIRSYSEVDGEYLASYNASGYKVSETNYNGGVTTYKYDGAMHVVTKTTPTGTTKYGYDKNGVLISKENEFGGVYTYERNSRGEVEKTIDPYGNVELFEFDDMGNLVAKQDLNGNIVNYKYDSIGNLIEEVNAYGSTQYYYDEVYNLIKVVDAEGNSTRYEYDSKNNLVRETSANGNEKSFVYDNYGNIVKVSDSMGILNQYQYDSNQKLVASIDAAGVITKYTYDAKGQLLTKTVADIVVEKNEYNAFMQLTKTYDANGVATEYKYDKNQVVYQSRANTATSTYVYNSIAQVSVTKDSYESASEVVYGKEGSVASTIDADGVVTTFKHDLTGRVIETSVGGVVTSKKVYYPTGIVKEEIDGNGNKKTYVIDNANRLAGVIDSEGNTHSYKYDRVGNVISEIDAYENKTLYKYDSVGNVILEENSLSEKTHYEYDLRGNLIKKIDADTNFETYKYDNAGKVVEVVKRNGVIVSYKYDEFGRVLKEEDSVGQKNTYTYDNNGNVLSEENQGKQKNVYTYDALNNLVKIKSFDGNVTSYVYDKESRLIKETDPLGNVKQVNYSAGGKTTSEIAINSGVTNYVYNNRGLLSEVSNPLDEVIKYEYDNNGNIVKELDSYDNSVVYEYNYNNQVTSKTNQVGSTEEYIYDALGNLVKEVDGNSNTTSYEYDSLSRVTSTVDALGFKTTYEYDVMGNVVSYVDGNGIEIEYKYDVDGNLLTEKYENNSTINYTYNLRGYQTSVEDGNGNLEVYAYDNLNRVVKEVMPSGNALIYVYDEKGDLVEEKDNISTLNKYSYNKVHSVVRKEDALGAVETYTYCNCGGLIESITTNNKTTTTYEYDLLNRVSSTTDERGVVTKFSYDIYGNTTEMKVNNTRVYNYEYDGASRLVKEINPLKEEVTYEYDSANNLLAKTTNQSTIKYEYDELNRVVEEEDALGYSVKYNYDAVNLVEEIDQEDNSTKYEYDSVGNIIKVENANNEIVSYSYDKNSNLETVSMNGRVVQAYKYDSSNNVISEKNVAGDEIEYEYDIRNNVSKEIKNDGQEIIMKYNNLNSMILSLASDNEIENEYDTNNNLLTSVQNGEVTEVKYNEHNDIVEYVDENNNTVKYTYDVYGNKTSVVYSDGSKVSYEYDELNRLIKITDTDGEQTSIKYDESGNRIAEVFPGSVVVASEYDKNNNLIYKEYKKEGKVILTLKYTYTARGQVAREERREYSDDESEGALQTIKSYKYDSMGQLEKADYEITKNGVVENISYEYSYNPYNNREEVKVTTNGEVEVITEKVNDAGQVIKREGNDFKTTYEYDENGNMIKELHEDGSSLTYEHNSLNQLVSVVSSDGYYETFDYDGLGNRVEKVTYTPYGVYNTNGYSSNLTLRQELENFVEEETSHKDKENETKTLREALEEDKECGKSEDTALDKKVIEYVNDINTEYEQVLEVKGENYVKNIYGDNYALISNSEVNMIDHKGSVIGSVGSKITTTDYTPQGSILNTKLIKSVEKKDVIGYNNEIEDNFDLQYLRARYYKQDEARFISQDTYTGSIGDKLSHNRYTYVENDSVNHIDPSGNKPPKNYSSGGAGGNERSRKNSGGKKKMSKPTFTKGTIGKKGREVYGPPAPSVSSKYSDLAKEIYNDTGVVVSRQAGMSDEEFYNHLVKVKKYCDDLATYEFDKYSIGEFVKEINKGEKAISATYADATTVGSDLYNRMIEAFGKDIEDPQKRAEKQVNLVMDHLGYYGSTSGVGYSSTFKDTGLASMSFADDLSYDSYFFQMYAIMVDAMHIVTGEKTLFGNPVRNAITDERLHFFRNELQNIVDDWLIENKPKSMSWEDYLESLGFKKGPPIANEFSDSYHENGEGNKKNDKFMSENGFFEIIVSDGGKGDIVLESDGPCGAANTGTFNYSGSYGLDGAFPNNPHYEYDMEPYYDYGSFPSSYNEDECGIYIPPQDAPNPKLPGI